jgi:superfamily II DNA helicase RecQ
MKLKTFRIRIRSRFTEKDEIKLNNFLENVVVNNISMEIVRESINYWAIIIGFLEKSETHNNHIDLNNEFTDEELNLIKSIKEWRTKKYKEEEIPAFMVLTNNIIINIVRVKPKTLESLRKIHGIGKGIIEKYGQDIISIINL